jgi:fibronectin type 3 domain-containing protein
LQWSASTDSRVQGYRVYYGTASRTYLQVKGSGVNTAQATTFVVNNLQAGKTYYFAVTAYDASQNESDYSAEVTKVIQ